MYHTVRPMAALPQLSGSLVSVLATIVFWLLLYGNDDALRALAKLSFAGAVPRTMLIERVPATGTPPTESSVPT